MTVDLVLFAGQSNMAGRGIVADRWPQEAPQLIEGAAFEYRAVTDPQKLHVLTEPFGVEENRPDGIYDIFSDGKKAKTGSMVTAFCNAYYARTNRTIVAVSASKGGSSIAQWLPDADTGYLKDAIGRIQAAKKYLSEHGYEIGRVFALWCQGETDGDLKTPQQVYRERFEQMWNLLHQEIPELFLVKIGRCNIEGQYDLYEEIRQEQDRIIEEIPEIHLAADAFWHFWEMGLMKDAFHYYQHGYNLCGEAAGNRVAESVLASAEKRRREVDGMSEGIRIECVEIEDTEELLAIYAPYVCDTAITFEYEVPSIAEFQDRIRKISAAYPYIKAVENGQILGYAYAGTFKGRKAYDWSVEVTVYVKAEARRKGIGKMLYQKLEELLKGMGILNVNACIAVPREEDPHLTDDSIHFHGHMGYVPVGTFHNSGYKFDTWYDMIWMEKFIGEHQRYPQEVRFGQWKQFM